MRKVVKLGHNAPKGYIVNKFNYIELEGDWAYCWSHNFIYNTEIEEEKLYKGLPCYYTDDRFVDGSNFYKSAYIFQNRRKPISLKSCIRKTMKCKGIPKGTIVRFEQGWYYPGKHVDGTYIFKIKKENKLDIEYQISDSWKKNFSTCEFSNNLTQALRENGFIVKVNQNTSFLTGMLNTAIALTGKGDLIDSKINGEIAVAYGHGKIIGFSSYNDDFRGYHCGCENILWDNFGEFNKWSRCSEIPKTTSIDEIIEILTDEEV